MANVEIHFNASAIREIFKSAVAQEACNAKARSICASANSACSRDNMYNPPFKTGGYVGKVSYHATVYAANPHGKRAAAHGVLQSLTK